MLETELQLNLANASTPLVDVLILSEDFKQQLTLEPGLGGTHDIFSLTINSGLPTDEKQEKTLFFKELPAAEGDPGQAYTEIWGSEILKKLGLRIPIMGYALASDRKSAYVVSEKIDAKNLIIIEGADGLPTIRMPHRDLVSESISMLITFLLAAKEGHDAKLQGRQADMTSFEKIMEAKNENHINIDQIKDVLMGVCGRILINDDDLGKGISEEEGIPAGNILVDKAAKINYIDTGGSGGFRGKTEGPKIPELSFSEDPSRIFNESEDDIEFKKKYHFVYALMNAIRTAGPEVFVLERDDVLDKIKHKIEQEYPDDLIDELNKNWMKSNGVDLGEMMKQQKPKINKFIDGLKQWLQTPILSAIKNNITK